MDLYAALMAGLVFSTNAKFSNTMLDFVLPGNGGVIVAAADWWRDPHGWTDRVAFLAGDLQSSSSGWVLRRNDTVSCVFASPDDHELPLLANARARTDLDRPAYLAALTALKAHVPEFAAALDEWITLVRQRPVVDPVADLVRLRTEQRDVGLLYLLGDAGQPVDVLVIDRNGDYAVRAGSPWLESIGSQYGTSEPLPPIRDFLAWAATESPNDGMSAGTFEVRTAEGTLEGIALRSLPSIV